MSDLARSGLDYPTAFELQRLIAHDPKCSAVQTNGGLLCDCDAIWRVWYRLGQPKTALEAVPCQEGEIGRETVCNRGGVGCPFDHQPRPS